MDDRIEQRITINAGLDRVWQLVSEPGWWVPTTADEPPDRTVGHRRVRTSEKWGSFTVEVAAMEPRNYAAFRWASAFPGEEPSDGRATLVEFFVKPLADAVEVTVVESGFAALDLPTDKRASAWKDNTHGWQIELGDLKERAERA